MQKLFAIILLVSLSLNAYLFFKLKAETAVLSNTKTRSDDRIRSDVDKPDTYLKVNNEQSKEATMSPADTLAVEDYQSPQALPAVELFRLLQTLQSSQKYTDLELPLREYLKIYPNDYQAWLIEADFILHTEPLSAAILFYYSLLEKSLPEEENSNVNRIIQLNTSKVIQQLTSDTAWDLLATFIEPLLQIDPLNRRYIMGLANAYGKQGQVILMENALAALPYDDYKAQQLRKLIYTPPELNDDSKNDATKTASLSKRSVDVIGNGQQFFVRTKINRYNQLLLLDTGASTTAISYRVFIKLAESDKEFVGRFTVQTAGGDIEAPLYKLTAITIGSITINNVSVIVLPDESFSGTFQGLLGMNVLRNFDFRFDQEKQSMTLFER
ncbi:MAG: clan AA aspartic protease (TIGR02281 family) [Glaciecola sp.]|jgi:clan AA aspartic protease (TIGR02281 family)